jgi:hypothetical protein
MLRLVYPLIVASVAVLAGCAKKEIGAYVVNVVDHDVAEMITSFGSPDQRQSRTGEMESLVWEEAGFSVQSTTKKGKVMRLVFLSRDPTLLESALPKVKERFAEGQSWRPDRKKVFDDVVEVVVREDSNVTIYRDKEAIYVFGAEIR